MGHLQKGLALLFLFHPAFFLPAEERVKRSPKEALQAFNDLIGSWRAIGEPEGTRQEKQRGFWTESLRWRWQFKGDDASLKVAVEKGKYFTKGELRYLPDRDLFQLALTTVANENVAFQGRLKDHVLTVEREEETKKETQRLMLTMLHGTRFLYRYEVRPQGRSFFTRIYQVGATKEGVPFADVPKGPECIVSGGKGTMRVTYNGKEYFVCCSGCRDEFKSDPEKYIKEAEAKANKK